MNRGVLQSSPVQQMMAAGNPNWCWSIRNNIRPPISTTHHQQTSPFLPPPNLFPHYIPPSTSSVPSWNDNQDQIPESWSQLLMGGLVGDEDKANMSLFQAAASSASSVMDVKQENSGSSCYVYGHHANDQDFQAAAAKPNSTWSPMMPNIASSPNKSCVTASTTFSSTNMLDFSTTTKADRIRHPPPDRSSECNSTATGGAAKKARVQASSSTQSTFKVRKEKLGDRITALHQLVSPFGKTDTASVLLEAIGYIRFLQSQIEALSLPYLGSGGSTNRRQQQQHPAVQGERNCIFPEDPGQLLNDHCIKRRGVSDQDCVEEPKKDLRSRGLCLVPVSCTLQVGSDNGADYWAPALGGGFR